MAKFAVYFLTHLFRLLSSFSDFSVYPASIIISATSIAKITLECRFSTNNFANSAIDPARSFFNKSSGFITMALPLILYGNASRTVCPLFFMGWLLDWLISGLEYIWLARITLTLNSLDNPISP